ncbi:hypothetical protein B0T21DRAFT_100446 [Apiosordaria backusii]|uniref:Uncharacterized protein n=1 Tax=Apiosordaria backusii TaxID=314023 RepID=A0AA40ETU8_9PEZI|nr:hypothetical protein B0T21DRAFT_100446 [Apiosordaria backusii]
MHLPLYIPSISSLSLTPISMTLPCLVLSYEEMSRIILVSFSYCWHSPRAMFRLVLGGWMTAHRWPFSSAPEGKVSALCILAA